MKCKFIIFFLMQLSLVSCSGSSSINIVGKVVVKGQMRYAKATISQYTSLKNREIQQTEMAVNEQEFRFTFLEDVQPGVYVINIEGIPKDFEVLIDGREREIKFDIDWEGDEGEHGMINPNTAFIRFTVSEQNKVWHEYKSQNKKAVNQIASIRSIANETEMPEVRDLLCQAYTKMGEEYEKRYTRLCKSYENTLLGELVKNTPYEIETYSSLTKEEKEEQFSHFWDKIDTRNSLLLNTNLYPTLVFDYLMFYIDRHKDWNAPSAQEDFIAATDTIVFRFAGNDDVYQYIVSHLQAVYMSLGMNKVLQYLDENYAGLCTEENLGDKEAETEMANLYRRRMEGYELTAVGKAAPNIPFYRSNGVKSSLFHLSGEHTVVFFWKTTCSHCMSQLPEIEQYLQKHSETAVLAVCMSPDKKEYEQVIAAYPHLSHTWESGEWQGVSATNYYVSGTPAFFVLDKKHRFVGTYYSWQQVEKVLS